MNKISQKILKMRLRKKWTQSKLSKKANVSQSTICRIENDCNKIQFKTVELVIKILQEKEYGNLWDNFFKLNEEESFVFLNELNKNKKIKTFIDYNPKKAFKIIKNILEKEYFNNWK